MDHPDWPAFMAAILADPDDDTVRLVAADFLEEHGDPERAAFVRVQCAVAALERDGQGKSLAADDLRKKERAFLGPLSVARLIWSAEACPELVRVSPPRAGSSPLAIPQVEGANRLTWRRGFVERVSCPAVEWLRHGAAVRSRQPVREVELAQCEAAPRDLWYAHLGALRGLARLGISAPDEDGWLGRWLPGTRLWVVGRR